MPDCICAIAPSEKPIDTVWFVKILERREADQPYTDGYSFTVAKSQEFLSRKYLERADETRHKKSFPKMKKTVFLQEQCRLSF